MYLGEVIGEALYYLILIFAILSMLYLIIKLAVKHAIIASLPYVKSAFKDSISKERDKSKQE